MSTFGVKGPVCANLIDEKYRQGERSTTQGKETEVIECTGSWRPNETGIVRLGEKATEGFKL